MPPRQAPSPSAEQAADPAAAPSTDPAAAPSTDPAAAPAAGTGREAQRRRTRAAILAAATGLLTGGASPSIDDIAAAADVSRRTVYLHFASLDQLLLDAAVGALTQAVIDAAIADAGTQGDAAARVDALVRAVVRSAPQTLGPGRKIIALTVDAPPAPTQPRRGVRRLQWIERALEPLREHLDAPRYERLVSGLSVLIGWEAMVVLRDVRGLDARAEEDTLCWAAAALVRAALDG